MPRCKNEAGRCRNDADGQDGYCKACRGDTEPIEIREGIDRQKPEPTNRKPRARTFIPIYA